MACNTGQFQVNLRANSIACTGWNGSTGTIGGTVAKTSEGAFVVANGSSTGQAAATVIRTPTTATNNAPQLFADFTDRTGQTYRLQISYNFTISSTNGSASSAEGDPMGGHGQPDHEGYSDGHGGQTAHGDAGSGSQRGDTGGSNGGDSGSDGGSDGSSGP